MKNKYIFILIGLIFLVLPLISASDDKLAYEPNETMEIITKCFDTDSNFCSTSTTCLLDIFYPNMTNFVYNETMTRNSTFYNYTAPATWTLGNYHASINCYDATTSGYSTFDFYVGSPSTDSQSRMTIVAIIILVFVSLLLFIAFIKIDSFPFKWSALLLGILFIVISINVVSIALWNEAGSESIRRIFDTLGAICYWMYWFIGGLLLCMWVLTTIASLADKKHMRQAAAIGQPIDFNKY